MNEPHSTKFVVYVIKQNIQHTQKGDYMSFRPWAYKLQPTFTDKKSPTKIT